MVETQKCLELGGLFPFCDFFFEWNYEVWIKQFLYSDHLASHENPRDFQFGDLWLFFFKKIILNKNGPPTSYTWSHKIPVNGLIGGVAGVITLVSGWNPIDNW